MIIAKSDEEKYINKGICPNCKENLIFTEGCVKCMFCGWGKCDS